MIPIPFPQIPKNAECPICYEAIQECEDGYQKLSYLNLATGPRYIAHEQGGRKHGVFHSWCFTDWIDHEIGQARPLRCMICRKEIDSYKKMTHPRNAEERTLLQRYINGYTFYEPLPAWVEELGAEDRKKTLDRNCRSDFSRILLVTTISIAYSYLINAGIYQSSSL